MGQGHAKRRIAILYYAASPVISGVEATIYHHVHGLADLGYQVQVVARRGEAFDDGVTFCHVPEIDSRHPEVLALERDLDEARVGEGFPLLQHRIAAALHKNCLLPLLPPERLLLSLSPAKAPARSPLIFTTPL